MNLPFRLTNAVKGLVIACFAMFVVQQTADIYFGGNLLYWLGLVPSGVVNHGRIWQIFTYSFLHGDVAHLFLNLFMLVFIGGELEAAWGTARFLRFYFACATGAAVLYLVLQAVMWRGDVPMIGASGAIYGLLMAYGLIFGERVLLFMMLFPMRAKHFVWVLAVIEFMSSAFSSRAGLASVAHLGGMAMGFALLWGRAAWTVYKRQRNETAGTRAKEKRKRGASHLKLVVNRRRGKGDGDGSDDHPKTWH